MVFARFSLICFPCQHICREQRWESSKNEEKQKEAGNKEQSNKPKQTIKSKKEEIQDMKMTVASKRKVRCLCEHTKHSAIQIKFQISPFSNMSLDTNTNIEFLPEYAPYGRTSTCATSGTTLLCCTSSPASLQRWTTAIQCHPPVCWHTCWWE